MGEDKPIVTFDEFAKLDIRVAKVLDASDHPNADKLICMNIDIGGERRQIVAGLKGHYTAESMIGKSIVVIANLAARKVRGVESQGMLLAAVFGGDDDRQVVVIVPDKDAPPGSSVS